MMLNDGSSQSKHKQIPMHLHEWGAPHGLPESYGTYHQSSDVTRETADATAHNNRKTRHVQITAEKTKHEDY
jgi:hypothetical protein